MPTLTAPDVRHTYLHLLTAAHQQVRTLQAWTGFRAIASPFDLMGLS
jgi:hypothetical protein